MGSDEVPFSILLASASPRREQLLREAGLRPMVFPVSLAESRLKGEAATQMAVRLAQSKCKKALSLSSDGAIVLAADTLVVDGDQVLGKPAGRAEAVEMLLSLRNREHEVITAVSVIARERGQAATRLQKTSLRMRNYSRDEVEAYVAGGAPMDKAGAYGIQDSEFEPVALDQFEGCYTNVMGLPLCAVQDAVEELGLELGPSVRLVETCFDFHPHDHEPGSTLAA